MTDCAHLHVLTRVHHRMMPIHPYYLGATPAPGSSTPAGRPHSMSQANLSSPSTTSPTVTKASNRQSMPPPARAAATPPAPSQAFEPTPEEADESEEAIPGSVQRRPRKGTMSRNFKFPSPISDAPPPQLPDPLVNKHDRPASPAQHASSDTEEVSFTPLPVIQSSVEVPPPPPIEKERASASADIDEDVGETEEISLN